MYPQSPFSSRVPGDGGQAAAADGQPSAAGGRARAARKDSYVRMSRLGFTGVLIAALGVGAVACGGSSGSGGSAAPAASSSATLPARGTGLENRIYHYLSTVPANKKSTFVHCMRSNGEPSFPSSLTLSALQSAGITMRSASFRTAFMSCKSTLVK